MKVGLFGGSFNPVHRQHLRIADAVAAHLGLDEVRFIPVFQPAHKAATALLPFEWRCRLLREALKNRPQLRVDTVERDLGGVSYTIRTVRHLRERLPGAVFWLIIGADSLADLPHWREHENLVRDVPLAVVGRPGNADNSLLAHPDSRWVELPPDGVSSSDIRRRLASGRFPVRLLPPGVAGLIATENFYGCWAGAFAAWIPPVRERLRALPEGLLEHVEGAAHLAAEYAAEQGIDPRAGFLAGLAHDLFRHLEADEVARLGLESPFPLTPLEREEPMLAHGAAAAGFLASLTPEVPRALLQAVRWHTFPRDRAGRLERALVMGDALDPSRGDPILDGLRESVLEPAERFRLVVKYKRERAQRKRRARGSGRPVPGASAGSPRRSRAARRGLDAAMEAETR